MRLSGRYIRFSFAGQNLAGAELCGLFIDADFTGADLTNAKLNGKFINTSFEEADLTDADLEDGYFFRTRFDRVILRERSTSIEYSTEPEPLYMPELASISSF